MVGGDLGEQSQEFAVAPGQTVGRPMPAQEQEKDTMSFTAEEEAFLKWLSKVVVTNVTKPTFAKSAIKDIRKDIITKGDLILALRDLPKVMSTPQSPS